MEMTEMLEVCTQARKNTSWWKWRTPALTLHAPQVLGVVGRFIADPVGTDPGASPTIAAEYRPTYGYSRGQCKQIEQAIDAHSRAVAEELGLL